MPSAPQGLCKFPGVKQVVSADFVLSHGITPGTCSMRIVPQDEFTASVGTLEFLFAGRRIRFRDCRVDRFSFQRNSSGQIIALTIYDRRWRWAYGWKSGRFNQGINLPEQKKNARTLAALLLDTMGEPSYDVSQIPNDIYPVVDWDYVNSAQALAELAESVGCRVVLRLNDSVLLARTGFGAQLPRANILNESPSIKLADTPDSIAVVGAATLVQDDLEIFAVGLDTDGEVKPIDDLSYKPATGWERSEPLAFGALDGGATAANGIAVPNSPRDLAKRTVFRWYQIGVPSNPGRIDLPPEFGFHITKPNQILPLETEQAETTTNADGSEVRKPAQVYGNFNTRNGTYTNTADYTEYKRSFHIIGDQGIVEFSDPVFKWTASGTSFLISPATLYLRTSFHVRERPDWNLVRTMKELDLGGRWDTGPRILRHDDIQLRIWAEYDQGALTNWQSNWSDISNEMDYYLQAAAWDYQHKFPEEIRYAGLWPIDPDGAIMQVGWSVGTSGATTTASRNTEFSNVTPTFKERRFYERLRNEEFAPPQPPAPA